MWQNEKSGIYPVDAKGSAMATSVFRHRNEIYLLTRNDRQGFYYCYVLQQFLRQSVPLL